MKDQLDISRYSENAAHHAAAKDKAKRPLDAAACSPPLGESGEAYYCKRDEFARYIETEVNPARVEAGLIPLDMKSVEECYRILNDFARKWGCKPIAENVKTVATCATGDTTEGNDA